MGDADYDRHLPETRAVLVPETRPTPGLLPQLGRTLMAAWSPHPLAAPLVDRRALSAGLLTRAVEVLRYQLLSLEYGLSRDGGLRAWLKLNTLLALLLLIPVVLVMPVITLLLTGLANWSALLLRIVSNLALTALWAIGLAVLLTILLGLVRQLRAQRPPPRDPWNHS